MKGYLFVVEPDSSANLGKVASLQGCKTEKDARRLRDAWQEEVGDEFVVLDSRLNDWDRGR